MGKYCRKANDHHIVKLRLSPEAERIAKAFSAEELIAATRVDKHSMKELIAMTRVGKLLSRVKEVGQTIGEYHTSEGYVKIANEIEDEIYRLRYIVPDEVYNPEHKFKVLLKESARPYYEKEAYEEWYIDFEKRWKKHFFCLRSLKYADEINAYYEKYDFERKRSQIFEILHKTLTRLQYDTVVDHLLRDDECELAVLEQQLYDCAKRNIYKNLLKEGLFWDILEES